MDFVIGRARPGGEPAAARGPLQRFRVLVVGDFSGRGSRREGLDTPPTFQPVRIDLDQAEAVFSRIAPRVRLALPQAPGTPFDVALNRFEDLEPEALFARLPLLARLRDLRTRLSHPATFAQAAAELRADEAARAAPPAPVPAAAPASVPASPAAAAEDDAATLARLLGGTLPPAAAPAPAAGGVAGIVDRLVRQAVAPHVVPATAHLQQPLIDSVDRALSDMLRSLLADPHWRSVEGAWRSVDRFLHGVEMDGGVQLELVDASAADLLDALVQAGGDAAQTPLAKTLAERRATQDQATGHAVVVALYEFGPGAAELALLASLAAIAAAQGAALLASAAAELALIEGGDAWQGRAPASDPAALARWQALRGSALAPHIGLVWPRLLARLPYGRRTQPVASFAFEEWLAPHAHEQLAWRPAALDLAALLARGFLEDGAELDPAAQVELEDLPAFIDRSGDDPRFQAVAEWFISEPQARAVSAAGVMPLLSHRSLPQAQVAGWRSISAGHSRLKGPWPG
ncbi:hypothetical protein ISF6_0356 [Piscinibacter sakaiensis]|uniref:TssC1 N-terminal domain-containing protein n=2 Tax=Piscinibacter sakaiensis TaxID=1547922 RepID=A0A0K8NWX3_PISS1|nr:hypothetical protein ISF6_0356 [Piscinibacter sakaiensis]